MSVLSSNHSALSQETHSAYSAGTTSGKSLMELKSLLVNQQCADESMGLDQNRSLVVNIQKYPESPEAHRCCKTSLHQSLAGHSWLICLWFSLGQSQWCHLYMKSQSVRVSLLNLEWKPTLCQVRSWCSNSFPFFGQRRGLCSYSSAHDQIRQAPRSFSKCSAWGKQWTKTSVNEVRIREEKMQGNTALGSVTNRRVCRRAKELIFLLIDLLAQPRSEVLTPFFSWSLRY